MPTKRQSTNQNLGTRIQNPPKKHIPLGNRKNKELRGRNSKETLNTTETPYRSNDRTKRQGQAGTKYTDTNDETRNR